MTPNFDLFRKLYARIAAKPEALVRLDWFRFPQIDCGTPFCVLGELVEMPEARSLGFGWESPSIVPSGRVWPTLHGRVVSPSADILCKTFGLTEDESVALFDVRQNFVIPEKQEALERIEALFAAHNEPLLIAEPVDTKVTVTA